MGIEGTSKGSAATHVLLWPDWLMRLGGIRAAGTLTQLLDFTSCSETSDPSILVLRDTQ